MAGEDIFEKMSKNDLTELFKISTDLLLRPHKMSKDLKKKFNLSKFPDEVTLSAAAIFWHVLPGTESVISFDAKEVLNLLNTLLNTSNGVRHCGTHLDKNRDKNRLMSDVVLAHELEKFDLIDYLFCEVYDDEVAEDQAKALFNYNLLNEAAPMNLAPKEKLPSIAPDLTQEPSMINFIKSKVPEAAENSVSRALGLMFGTPKGTGLSISTGKNMFELMHVSAGEKNTPNTCSLFFIVHEEDKAGNGHNKGFRQLLAIGQHKQNTKTPAYEILCWKKKCFENQIPDEISF